MGLITMRERWEQARASGRPLIAGHRGNPAEHPENTLRSFRSALDLGLDLVECDVHLSADGDLIVIHDHAVDRTTNGSGLVRGLATAQLRALDAGDGEQVPLLDEVIELVCPRAGLLIEIKQAPLPYQGLEEQLVKKLRSAGVLEETAVLSFHHPSVKVLKELEPRIQTSILEVGRPVDAVALMRQAGADVYSPHFSGADPELVRDVHAAGGWVGVWTVDDQVAIAWTKHCGVDSVATNRPSEVASAFR